MNILDKGNNIYGFELVAKEPTANGFNMDTKWIIDDTYKPVVNGNKIEFKALEDIVVPSMIKSFMGAANNSISNLSSKLGNIWGKVEAEWVNSGFDLMGDDKQQFKQSQQAKYGSGNTNSHKSIEISLGFKAIMPSNKVLVINLSTIANGLLVVSNNNIYNNEIVKLSVFNTLPTSITIPKGSILAEGFYQEVIMNPVINIVMDNIHIGKPQDNSAYYANFNGQVQNNMNQQPMNGFGAGQQPMNGFGAGQQPNISITNEVSSHNMYNGNELQN